MTLTSTVMLAILLATFPYIDLELSLPIGGHVLNAPLGDLVALALFPIGAFHLVKKRVLPPGWPGFAAFLAVGAISAMLSDNAPASLHEWLRKPVFSWFAYGLGVFGAVACAADGRWLRISFLTGLSLVAAVSLITSVGRIVAGDTLWFAAIDGLTNNHKTLAVALAPAIVLAWGWNRDRFTWGVTGLATLAVVASVSRTAWIALAVGSCWYVVVCGRILADRKGFVGVVMLLGVVAATYGPIVTGSLTQLDALRSRHSLDLRAIRLFRANPWFGAGAGAGVRDEAQTFPHYRVNGVDAHGAIQKVSSEYGIFGMAAYGSAVVATGLAMRRRHRPGGGTWPCWVALHTNLLLSTETFTETHWAIFALSTGLAAREA